MADTQKCGRCKETKPAGEFSPSYRGKPGTWCRSCFAAHARGERITVTYPPRPCSVCGVEYIPKQVKIKNHKGYCSQACKEAGFKASGQRREGHLRRRYGITQADYDAKLAEQGGGCALCGVRPEELAKGRYRTWLHVDHDHESGRVRGLLCPDHNLLLGRWGDDPAMLRRAADYIEGVSVGADAAGGAVPG
jgi:Recombination endonuclease VII